ncbi:MAG TPA: LacI family DNA-binding transcriptional regulator [Gaiellaceae bacterium]|nr:LacI family DNA-binding transcriptional regulator [Gaiellaceae bacterium]
MNTRSPGHPTLADVAAAAGVSLSTASRALRRGSPVSEATRRRVQGAARRLGYEPNQVARSLRTRASFFAGVILPDIGVGFYARALKGAQDALERAGYQVIVMNTERQAKREAAALRTLLAHRVHGILLATSGGFSDSRRVPVVFFDNLVEGAGAGHVARANREGMKLLVDHLVQHGHERIGYVGAPPRFTSGIERLDGFRGALAAAGLPSPAEYVALGDDVWSVESGQKATLELLSLPARPTGLVAASDTLAVGAIQAARAAGLRVPEDIAVVSFDDPFFGDLLDPPITALARSERQLGELAASLLLHAIETKRFGPPTEVRLPVELIVRGSCGRH